MPPILPARAARRRNTIGALQGVWLGGSNVVLTRFRSALHDGLGRSAWGYGSAYRPWFAARADSRERTGAQVDPRHGGARFAARSGRG